MTQIGKWLGFCGRNPRIERPFLAHVCHVEPSGWWVSGWWWGFRLCHYMRTLLCSWLLCLFFWRTPWVGTNNNNNNDSKGVCRTRFLRPEMPSQNGRVTVSKNNIMGFFCITSHGVCKYFPSCAILIKRRELLCFLRYVTDITLLRFLRARER